MAMTSGLVAKQNTVNKKCESRPPLTEEKKRMNVANDSLGRIVNKDGGRTYTRVSVLRDFQGSHVFLQKRKRFVRKNDMQTVSDNIFLKSDVKSRENYDNARRLMNNQSRKIENSKSAERKDLEKDGRSMNCLICPTMRESPENSDQEHIKNRHTLDNGAALINLYFETETLHLRESNVFEILRLAFDLKLMDVYNACVLFLSHSLTVGNCIKIWRLSRKFQSYTLAEQVVNFMEQHLTTCLTRKDQVSVVTSLLNSTNDFHSLEFLLQLFSCHSYENTAKVKGSIMKLLSKLMKQESMIWRYYFKDYLHQLEDVKDMQDDACQSTKITEKHTLSNRIKDGKKVISVMNEGVSSKEGLGNKELNLGKTLRNQNGKLTRVTHDMSDEERKGVLVAGGINDQTHEALDAVFLYEPKADIWTALPSLTHARFNHTVVTVNGKIYVIGGKRKSEERIHSSHMKEGTELDNKRKNEQNPCSHPSMSCDIQHLRASQFMNMTNDNCHISISPNNLSTLYQMKGSHENSWGDNIPMSSVEVFSTESNKWCEVSSMILKRKEHSSVAVGDSVYVLGGHDGVAQLCSMEKYYPLKDEWTFEKPRSRLCNGMNVVTDKQFLYVIGGYSGNEWLNTLSCYDTMNKTWIDNFPTMRTGRAFAGAELVAEDIFIFGGVNSQGCLDKCEIFNTTSKTWRKGPCMNQPRCNAGHCVFERKIFVFGGEACGILLNTVEYLDIEKWEWKMAKKMPIRTAGLRCVQTNVFHDCNNS